MDAFVGDAWQESVVRRARVAVLAPTDSLYGLNRQFQGLGGDEMQEHISAFRDRDEALAWLWRKPPRTEL